MSTINHAMRASILETLGKDRMTTKQIAHALKYESDIGVRSALRAMKDTGQVRCAKGPESYHPARWWAA